MALNIFTKLVLVVILCTKIHAKHNRKFVNSASPEKRRFGDVFDVLQGMISSENEHSPLSDVFKRWWQRFGQAGSHKETSYMEYDDMIKGSTKDINREHLWKIWEELNPQTRDVVLKSLKPILVDARKRKWRLHCADAYRMCQADTNCYVQYWNYENNCLTDSHARKSSLYGEFALEVLPYKIKRVRRNGRSKKSRKFRRRGRNRKRPTKKVSWMGRYDLDEQDVLKYFSMKTKSNKCSSKCVNALIMLNNSVYGSLLVQCDCSLDRLPTTYKNSSYGNIFLTKGLLTESATEVSDIWDERMCRVHQNIAQECRPRKFKGSGSVVGCTEARLECEKNKNCLQTQENFLSACSGAISGGPCSLACNESTIALSKVSNFNSCICDGTEGPTCRRIRSNIYSLCSSMQSFQNKSLNADGEVRMAQQQLQINTNSSTSQHSRKLFIFLSSLICFWVISFGNNKLPN